MINRNSKLVSNWVVCILMVCFLQIHAQDYPIYLAVPPGKITASCSSELQEFPVKVSYNGKGMRNDKHISDNLGRNMWISEISKDSVRAFPGTKYGVVWLNYELSHAMTIDRISLWNHNQHNHLNRGLQKVYIQYSEDGVTWYSLSKNNSETITIPRSNGEKLESADLVLDINKKIKYLCITADQEQGNYYHDGNARTMENAALNNQNVNYYGLSEIRFYIKETKTLSELPKITTGAINVTQGYINTKEGPKREGFVSFEKPLYTGGELHVSVGNRQSILTIPKSMTGLYEYPFYFPSGFMDKTELVDFKFKSKQGGFKMVKVVKPAREWIVYFIPHSHLDIGYTHTHEGVLKRQMRNIDIALELIEQTKDFPEEAQFKWNIETVWPLLGYKKNYFGTRKWESFKNAVQNGSIGINAALGNLLTGLSKPEELMHAFDDGITMGENLEIPIRTVMMSDVPGFSWGLVTAMAENEIKYFSMAPNFVPHLLTGGSRVGLSHINWANRPFYWQSQSGQSKVLCWSAGTGYSYFHDWLAGPLSSSGLAPIWGELKKLEKDNFPYNMTYFRYTVNGDNGPPDQQMSSLVKKWNNKYASPKFVIGTMDGLFQGFEAKYKDHIPTFEGDFTPYWEDGAASTAVTLAMNRRNSTGINQLEILNSIINPDDFPTKLFNRAWRNILLFSEHTWGASASGTDPESAFTHKLWEQKRAFAEGADSIGNSIKGRLKKSLRTIQDTVIHVFNTNLYSRSDVVVLEDSSIDLSDKILLDEKGNEIAVQKNNKGHWLFIASGIPPLSSKKYHIDNTASQLIKSPFIFNEMSLSNGKTKVEIDENTGVINGLIFSDGNNYADDDGLNRYIYSGRNLEGLNMNQGEPVISLMSKGPVFATVRITSKPEGTHGLSREITLYNGLDRLDIRNTIDKTKSTGFENIRFEFSFNIKNPETEIDLPFSLIRPEREQLSGANKNFFSMNNGVAIQGLKYGVLLANSENPILEVGSLTGEHWMKDTKEFLAWKRQSTSSATVYSWVMNNSWMTNYKRSQEGMAEFEYSIIPLKLKEDKNVKIEALNIARPLRAFIGDAESYFPSLFSLSGDPQISLSTLKPSKDGKGFILRLTNMSDRTVNTGFEWGSLKAKKVFRCTNRETVIAEVDDQNLWMFPYQTLTLKLEL